MKSHINRKRSLRSKTTKNKTKTKKNTKKVSKHVMRGGGNLEAIKKAAAGLEQIPGASVTGSVKVETSAGQSFPTTSYYKTRTHNLFPDATPSKAEIMKLKLKPSTSGTTPKLQKSMLKRFYKGP